MLYLIETNYIPFPALFAFWERQTCLRPRFWLHLDELCNPTLEWRNRLMQWFSVMFGMFGWCLMMFGTCSHDFECHSRAPVSAPHSQLQRTSCSSLSFPPSRHLLQAEWCPCAPAWSPTRPLAFLANAFWTARASEQPIFVAGFGFFWQDHMVCKSIRIQCYLETKQLISEARQDF